MKLVFLIPVLLMAFVEAIFTSVAILASTVGGLLAIVRVWLHNDYSYLQWLKRDLADCKRILELGCGRNSPILKIGYGHKTDAVDIWQPYVELHTRQGDYRKCEQADILEMQFADRLGKYDAVVICDVLEHLPKDRVYSTGLLDKIEQVARKKVVLFTPNGFVENDEVDGDPYQAHVSAWWPQDYTSRGYKVVGSTGLRWLMGKASLPKYHPYQLFMILIILTQPLVFNHPKIAWHSYAVKELR